jgi:ATP-dependent DNA helicase RecG
VGTHAVFQKDVEFADLRLAIVDEQHRFGVRQRLELGRKGAGVDMLVMTATPIPRSLSLAQYGDMDVSVLDEKPPGRKPIKTALVSMGRMDEVVDHLRRAIAEGRQAYWVCPLVEESEAVDYVQRGGAVQAVARGAWRGGCRAGSWADAARREGRGDGRVSARARHRCWWRQR